MRESANCTSSDNNNKVLFPPYEKMKKKWPIFAVALIDLRLDLIDLIDLDDLIDDLRWVLVSY